MVASPLQLAKRALVSLLLSLARQYAVALAINLESPDKVVLDSFGQVARKAHPDKGASKEHMRKLNESRDQWKKAAKAKAPLRGTLVAVP